jgi:hypothetical protein
MNKILLEQNINILEQLKESLILMPTDAFVETRPLLEGSSLGMHIRHVIEFYECLINGLPHKVVNYDSRVRNLELQSNKDFAINCITAIQLRLEDVVTDVPLILQAGKINDDDFIEMPSSYLRELYYMLEHCTHHMALIKMVIMQYWPNVQLPANYGVAQSTIKYKQSVHSYLSANK